MSVFDSCANELTEHWNQSQDNQTGFHFKKRLKTKAVIDSKKTATDPALICTRQQTKGYLQINKGYAEVIACHDMVKSAMSMFISNHLTRYHQNGLMAKTVPASN